MADGTQLDHIIKRGYAKTTDATETTLVSVDLTDFLGTDATIFIEGWVQGYHDITTNSYIERMITGGFIQSGSVSINNLNQVSLGSGGSGSNSYDASLSVDQDIISIEVNGDAGDNVFWQGRITVEITEATIEAGGGGD